MIRAIDTHVHFWELAGYRGYDGWFAGRDYLRRDYLPHHLRPELAAIGVGGRGDRGGGARLAPPQPPVGRDVRAA